MGLKHVVVRCPGWTQSAWLANGLNRQPSRLSAMRIRTPANVTFKPPDSSALLFDRDAPEADGPTFERSSSGWPDVDRANAPHRRSSRRIDLERDTGSGPWRYPAPSPHLRDLVAATAEPLLTIARNWHHGPMTDVPIPTYQDLMYPTLQALTQLGGSASNAELEDVVPDMAGVTEEQLAVEFQEPSRGAGARNLIHRTFTNPTRQILWPQP